MSKVLTSGKAQAKISSIETKLIELLDELQAAQAREVLEIGAEYPIYQGRGEERTVVKAKLLAQRVTEDGTTTYAFQVVDTGEFATGTARVIAKETAEGEEKLRSSDKIKKVIERLEADKEATEKALEEALARENLNVGETYRVRVGRGKTAEIVYAVLLGIGETVKVKKQVAEDGTETSVEVVSEALNFFYGSGFDARTVLVGRGNVVFTTEAEEAEAAAEAQADADAADAEAQGE